MKTNYFIRQNSLLAFISRKVLRTDTGAIVIGKTIYLNGVKKELFLANRKWFNHELCHIRQFKKYGFFRFMILYLIESIKNGYQNNRFEIEARSAEEEGEVLI